MRFALTLVLFSAFATCAAAADGPYKLVKTIHVGGPGGWDYISVDPAAGRVYLAHSTRVVVVDVAAGTIAGEIGGTDGVHGFALAPDLGRGFSSNGRANSSTIVDLATLKPIATVPTGARPDAIMYDPDRREVYTLDGTGKSATVFDARTGTVTATVPLGGKPEAPVLDRDGHRVLVNIEDRHEVAIIDTATHTKTGVWPLDGCEDPTGIAYAPAERRVFTVCRNKVLLMLDGTSGRVLARLPIGGRVDGAAFDPGTGYVFTSNGDGTVTIAHLEKDDTLTPVQTLTTRVSGRTMALDPVSHALFVPASKTSAGPDGTPQPVADTLDVLVYSLK